MPATERKTWTIDDPENDVLKDCVTELRLATEPHLFDIEGECWCEVPRIELIKTMDDALLTSAEWEGEYERGGEWFTASAVWRLYSVIPAIIDGRNSWRCVYRVDVE